MNSQILVSESGAIAQEIITTSNTTRGLSVKQRKTLGENQRILKQKENKIGRLTKEKVELKKTLKRGFLIVKPKPPKDGEETVELKKTHITLSSTDRLKIKDRIIDIDIELFDVKAEINQLKKEISSKRHKSIKAKKNVLSGKRMAQQQKRNATSPGEEDSAPVYLYQPETELEDTQSSDGEFDFMDKREPVAVPLQKKETKVSVNTDAEVIQE